MASSLTCIKVETFTTEMPQSFVNVTDCNSSFYLFQICLKHPVQVLCLKLKKGCTCSVYIWSRMCKTSLRKFFFQTVDSPGRSQELIFQSLWVGADLCFTAAVASWLKQQRLMNRHLVIGSFLKVSSLGGQGLFIQPRAVPMENILKEHQGQDSGQQRLCNSKPVVTVKTVHFQTRLHYQGNFKCIWCLYYRMA